MLAKVFNLVVIVWPVSEVALGLLSHAKRGSAEVRDRGSLLLLWVAIAVGLTAGNLIRFSAVGSIGAPRVLSLSAALAVIVSGLALRWTAILRLGRFFTSNVAIQPDHAVVRSGVYRYVRHPAYSGMLLSFLGAGLAFDNWLSLVVITVPVTAALLYRMHVEEQVLVDMLGREYVDYCSVTRRLIPGIY
jgi:protein-S-isoprenylcysteine O-methyltransferase Ste14